MIIKSFKFRLGNISKEDFDEMIEIIKSYFEIIKVDKKVRKITIKPNKIQTMNMQYMLFNGNKFR